MAQTGSLLRRRRLPLLYRLAELVEQPRVGNVVGGWAHGRADAAAFGMFVPGVDEDAVGRAVRGVPGDVLYQ